MQTIESFVSSDIIQIHKTCAVIILTYRLLVHGK